MAEKSGFFNSSGGDRTYAADFFAEYFASFIGNGVYPSPSTACQVIASGNMTVALSAGQAWINGYYYHNTDNLILNLDIADGVLKRIDRIVLRYTVLNREIKAYVKKGTFASTPVAPSLQRDADAYELGIADIFIENGVVSVTQSNITDLRLNNNYCGIVHGVVDQVNTTTIFNQYLEWFEQTKNNNQQEFNAWFENLEYVLSGDVAGNLLTLINANTETLETNTTDIAAMKSKITTGVISTTWAGSVVPFTQIILNSDITITNEITITLAPTATQAETEEWNLLVLQDGGQSSGSFTFRNWGTKNTMNIPIVITVRGA